MTTSSIQYDPTPDLLGSNSSRKWTTIILFASAVAVAGYIGGKEIFSEEARLFTISTGISLLLLFWFCGSKLHYHYYVISNLKVDPRNLGEVDSCNKCNTHKKFNVNIGKILENFINDFEI